MLEVIAENKAGQQLKLSHNPYYTLMAVSGVTPPKANINTANLATKDGSVFNSSMLNNRNIVLTVLPVLRVEQARLNLYKVFKSKQYIKLYFKTASRNVWIEGYIESMETDLYANPQKIQISVICPDPYLKAVEQTVVNFSNVTNEFVFPVDFVSAGVVLSTFSQDNQVDVYNDSDDETGFIAQFYMSGTVNGITLINDSTGQSFSINYAFGEGDELILNTKRGEKSVILVSGGVQTNLINYMEVNSDWITLQTGDNLISYTTSSGLENLFVKVILQPIYEGV